MLASKPQTAQSMFLPPDDDEAAAGAADRDAGTEAGSDSDIGLIVTLLVTPASW